MRVLLVHILLVKDLNMFLASVVHHVLNAVFMVRHIKMEKSFIHLLIHATIVPVKWVLCTAIKLMNSAMLSAHILSR